MFKKIIFILFVCFIQHPSYGMQEENIEVENYQNSTQIIQLRTEDSNKIEPQNKKVHLLFLCTGNSCRSQMAEGWARHLGSDVAEVNSAGIKSHGLNPNAVKIMKEVEVDITNQTSKVIESNMFEWADVVVTVCGHANENCPLLPKKTKKIHWPIKDPAKAIGLEEEVMKEFRRVRDEIYKHVFELLNEFRENSK